MSKNKKFTLKNFKLILILFILILFILFLKTFTKKQNSESNLLIFAAVANKAYLDTAVNEFKKIHPEISININYGGSGTLLSNLNLTKKADIYIPAAFDYIIIGISKKLLLNDSVTTISYLIPSIIVKKDNPLKISGLKDLANKKLKIAIVNPETGAIGKYTAELLFKANLFEKVYKNIVGYTPNLAQLLNLLLLNKVDAVISWRITAFWNKNLSYVPIEPYYIPRISSISGAITSFSKNKNNAKLFLKFLTNKKIKQVLTSLGYIVELSKAKKFAPDAKIGGNYKLPPKYFEILNTYNKK